MPSSLSAHPSLSIPALDAFQLQLTPFELRLTRLRTPPRRRVAWENTHPLSRSPPAGEDPSEARVDEVHAEYVEAVRALFQAHKRDAGYGEEETLTVI